MKQIIFAIIFITMTGFAPALVAIFVAADFAQAASCTGLRDKCLESSVNLSNSKAISKSKKRCKNAHSACMKTGIWHIVTKYKNKPKTNVEMK